MSRSSNRLRVLVYRDELLPFSQTFVANQVRHLPADLAALFGSRRVPSEIQLPTPHFVIGELYPDDGGTVKRQLARWQVARFKLGWPGARVVRHLKALQGDVLIAHFASDGLRVSRLAQRLAMPLVVYLHGSDVLATPSAESPGHFGARRLARNWPRLGRRASAFICVSHEVVNAAERRGLPKDKLHRIPLGIAVPDIDVAGAIDMHANSRRLLFVGRLHPGKGLDHALKALSRLRELDWTLEVLGDGPDRGPLKELAKELGIADRVAWGGVASPATVASAMSVARALLVPSIPLASGASEGLPTVILEAKSLALPVCAYATGGIPEAFDGDESDGLLVEPGDIRGLAARLRCLIADDDLVRRVGTRGRRTVEIRFDAAQRGREVDELLRRMVHAGADGR